MALDSGTRLGPYELVSLLGTGGMGEVYEATDTRLSRTVAIKVLPEHLASDPSRRERFEREARAISALNHPHICTVHDVGKQDGIHYLVMELVEGETLERRLASGRLPLDQAVEYAIQIADALDKAHRKGVVHRDLKPGNVMLTGRGVKLLDFGLAKLRAGRAWTSELSQAPTEEALTAEGTIPGTLRYMAPEQLEGGEADSRTDIFAFGALVYEMVTGTRAFEGKSQAGLIAAIMSSEPQPMVGLQRATPPALGHVVSRCLEKDPEDRWQAASDVMQELKWARTESVDRPSTSYGDAGLRRRLNRLRWATVLTGIVAAASLAAFVLTPAPDTPGSRPVQFQIFPGAGTYIPGAYGVPFAVSPDGGSIVLVGSAADGNTQLWLRPFGSEVAQPVAGTEGALGPFWAPDGERIGFFAGDKLEWVPASGGEPRVMASGVRGEMSSGATGGASWSREDVILFKAAPNSGLARVALSGGAIATATELDSERAEINHFWPQFLPDGEHFIYTALGSPSTVYSGSLTTGETHVLLEFDASVRSNVLYAPGYLFFVQDAALYASPFDEARLTVSEHMLRIVDGVPKYGPGVAPFSVSAGVLAYWRSTGENTVLRWVDRDGNQEAGPVAAPAQVTGFAMRPDGRSLLMSRFDANGSRDIWSLDLTDGREDQLTHDGDSFAPRSSPSGDRFVFASARNPPPDVFMKTLQESGDVQLTASPTQDYPTSWSTDADGNWIVFESVAPTGDTDLWAMRLEDKSRQRLPFSTPFPESQGRLSSDGRWLAYVSDETGRSQVRVTDFPSGNARRTVSSNGGTMPEWRQDGRELFYLSDQGQMMSVTFDPAGGSALIGEPRELFTVPPPSTDFAFNTYVVTPDGQRFLVAMPAQSNEQPPINVVLNWEGRISTQ